jgi:hypothetical protein
MKLLMKMNVESFVCRQAKVFEVLVPLCLCILVGNTINLLAGLDCVRPGTGLLSAYECNIHG